jgi:hypothetical protein
MSHIENTDNTNTVDIDDDIDESFDDKPKVVEVPELLSNEDLDKIHTLMKTKSNKEIIEIITKLVSTDTNQTEFQKIQVQSGLLKNLGSSSKRDLLNMLDTIVTEKNKHVIFESSSKLQTVSDNNKQSNDELRKKLHQKIQMSNKKNQQQMYEKLMEQFQQSQKDSENQPNQSNETGLKPKKKKKINNKLFQDDIVNQMAELLKNNNIL